MFLTRLAPLAVLATAAACALAPTAADARSGVFYTAELTQPTEQTRAVAGGVAWVCKGTTCVAPRGTSRPLRVCRELQREVGAVASFTAQGKELDADKLESCNG